MTATLTTLARRFLPPTVRRPLGSAVGYVHENWIRYLQGLIFDLRGGIFRVDGCELEIPTDLTTRAYRSCFLSGDYEAEERALIRRLVRPEDRVLELGACLGIVSCVTNRLLRDRTKHLVVEGNPKLIPWIERNRQRNGAGFAIENAAASREREVTFYLHPRYIVGGTAQRKSEEPVTVPGRSLEALHAERGPFDVMIMDIEGGEIDVLPGAEELLKSYRLVIIELHPWATGAEGAERCREILRTAGLRHADTVGDTEAWLRGG
jgi:FkbM family methyltransferase